jgi:hypothetical protein
MKCVAMRGGGMRAFGRPVMWTDGREYRSKRLSSSGVRFCLSSEICIFSPQKRSKKSVRKSLQIDRQQKEVVSPISSSLQAFWRTFVIFLRFSDAMRWGLRYRCDFSNLSAVRFVYRYVTKCVSPRPRPGEKARSETPNPKP